MIDGVDALRKRIREENEAEIESLLSAARQEAEALLANARDKAEQLRAEREAKVQRQAEAKRLQAAANQRLSERRVALQEKQNLLQDTLMKAQQALEQYDTDRRKTLYAKWLADAPPCKIIICKVDEPFMEEWLSQLAPEIEIEAVRDDFKGGFILRQGQVYQDYRFDVLIKRDEVKYTKLAAQILFDEFQSGAALGGDDR